MVFAWPGVYRGDVWNMAHQSAWATSLAIKLLPAVVLSGIGHVATIRSGVPWLPQSPANLLCFGDRRMNWPPDRRRAPLSALAPFRGHPAGRPLRIRSERSMAENQSGPERE